MSTDKDTPLHVDRRVPDCLVDRDTQLKEKNKEKQCV